ncbi:MAG: glycosyltransferase [Chloroflexi bacterium]|nr:glycosyltransferase [Chloroflexota bacterium]
MRVALVHDWLNQYGGAERVLEVLHDLFPTAPIYTSMFAPEVFPPSYRSWDIRTSFLQRLPQVTRKHQRYLPFYPAAFETFDLSGYDLVLSNSSGFCHLVRTPPATCHLNYCLTPPRFLWNLSAYLDREQIGGLLRRVLPLVVAPLRSWDARARQRVDAFVAISQAVQQRIRRCYGRESGLVYPPVDCAQFTPSHERGDYYLIVSRLVPYKRVDLAVQAFNRLGLPLLIAGTGRDRAALEARAAPNVKFLGRVPQDELAALYAGCRAFLFPGEEDFGIAPLEAQAAGRPVIAYAAGGALETVVAGQTGVFFHEPTPEALAAAVEQVEGMRFDHRDIRRHAEEFDLPVFRRRLMATIDAALAAYRAAVR